MSDQIDIEDAIAEKKSKKQTPEKPSGFIRFEGGMMAYYAIDGSSIDGIKNLIDIQDEDVPF